MKHVITVLADGFEEVEAVTVIDLLRRAQIKVTVLGLHAKEVGGSHGIQVRADELLKEFSGEYDGIVLPGGMPGTSNLAASETVIRMVKESFEAGRLCAAICAAPMVLGRAGILRGFRAACYPGFEEELVGATNAHESVVRDRNVITSRGAGTAIPFSLELISYLADPEAASKVKSAILWGGC